MIRVLPNLRTVTVAYSVSTTRDLTKVMEKRSQPKWLPPSPKSPVKLPPLYLFNSLTLQKEPFIPEEGKVVRWYTCGPTVYDLSHMGHARTYIAFDILRRVMMNYFMFDVKYVVNITDIDDKIIKRARQNFLFTEYLEKERNLADVCTDISKAIRNIKKKSVTDPDPDKRAYLEKEADRLEILLGTVPPAGTEPVNYLTQNARDAIADILDKEMGATVTDHALFGRTSQHYETEYHVDMKALNVLDPDVLVRVTEYIDPIIKFVQRIIDRGYGYASSSGSVYFDTQKFANDPSHFYAKLVPTAFGDTSQLATGEGDLTVTVNASGEEEKRSSTDFALWKASKPGEPAWPSPWGQGRPGWHIECSAMATDVLGRTMDIHAGGIDLKFPHHDNELAQSEANLGHSQWVHYFLHSGHLTISGCKMAKSLKNFITIRDALRQHSARRIRLVFLLHSWRDTMDYSADTLAEAIAFEKTLVDFLYNATSFHLLVSEWERSAGTLAASAVENGSAHSQISAKLDDVQKAVYEALCDSCDTRRVAETLRELMSFTEQHYLSPTTIGPPSRQLLHQVHLVAVFLLRLLNLFGLAESTRASQGSPLPDGALIAAGTWSHSAAESLLLQGEKDVLAFSWLSIDSLSETRINEVLRVAFVSVKALVDLLVSEGEPFQSLANSFVKTVLKEYGVDISNLLSDESTYLAAVISTTSGQSVAQLVSSASFGLETVVWPIVYRLLLRLVSLRQSVRVVLLNPDKASLKTVVSPLPVVKKRILEACDRLRDESLASAGLRLQDRVPAAAASTDISGPASTPSLGLVDPVMLTEELNAKKKRESERAQAAAQQKLAREEAGRLPPSEMFRGQVDKFSRFDDTGMPTHDSEGKQLSKAKISKLRKLYDAQAKRHATFLKTQN